VSPVYPLAEFHKCSEAGKAGLSSASAPRRRRSARGYAPVMQTVVPMLAYEDGLAAIDWLNLAFGVRENEREGVMSNRTRTTAELDVGDGSVVFVATPSPEYESPAHHREGCEQARRWQDNPWVIDGVTVSINDLNAHADRARASGARILREPEDVADVGL